MIKKYLLFSVFSLIFTSIVCSQSVTIDADSVFQTIDGFGGMNHTSWVKDLNNDQRAKTFSNDPGSMGLSMLRIHIDPDSDRFLEQVSTTTFAVEQGAKIFATPWDPPAELKDSTSEQTRIPYENYSAYVDHLNGFNKFMLDHGIELEAISVQNEPDYGEWARWTADEMFTFVKENAGDINNNVIAAESFQFRKNFTDPILNDSTAASHVEIIGGHIYGGGLEDYPLAREKGKRVWMTEHLTGSNSGETNEWTDAMNLGKEIHDCMEANFNAYNYWYIRRFYGLITEDGNISHKGYAMAHFSKFIRPDFTRIEATVESASGVYATAYKSDTSMVIVAINTTTSSQQLTFKVDNANYDEFVLFSSNGNEYLVNKGAISASGGTFTATLEAGSIATLTTDPSAGGKANNKAPIAVAGDDKEIEDTDATSFETIMLDATKSTDADGEIVNYSWALNGEQLATTAKYEIELPIGEHEFILTVTDNDGARDIDTMLINITSIFSSEFWFEAECINVGATWEIAANELASNGAYITTPLGTESTAEASENPDDLMSVTFTVTEAGAYKVWGRVIAPSANDDSFWVKIDTSSWSNWNGIPAGDEWHWDDVHDGADENPVFYNLEEGEHTLYICFREDGAWLDKIAISNTGAIPSDLGGEAEACDVVLATTELWFEAECVAVGANWETNTDGDASNGKYVNTPSGVESPEGPLETADDLISVTFDVTESTSYTVWCRVKTPSGDDDSFYVRMDDGEWVTWNQIPASSSWQWDDVHGGDGQAAAFSLNAGEHTLQICYREDGALLDKILIANTGITPTEMGGDAEACGVGISDIENTPLNIYPNPSSGQVSIEWENTFSRVDFISLDGKIVMTKNYHSLRHSDNLDLKLEKGIYLVRVVNNRQSQITQLIIE